jgi:nicotinate (nicotinamide) nucleotide adenylyltransferase
MSILRPPGPVAKGLRIGLMGGSFNPAHEGHRYVAETAIRRLGLDYVWMLVAPQNPLKPIAGMASLEERLAGARKLVGDNRRLIVSDIEAAMASRYTVDTVRALKTRFGAVQFVWLMGSDNLEQFHRWRRWRDILAAVPAAVVLRPGSTLAPLKAKASRICPDRFTIIDGRRNPASATAIRARLAPMPGA